MKDFVLRFPKRESKILSYNTESRILPKNAKYGYTNSFKKCKILDPGLFLRITNTRSRIPTTNAKILDFKFIIKILITGSRILSKIAKYRIEDSF